MTKITSDQIKDALMRSGYLLENRVTSLLLKKQFWSETNTNFLDKTENKYREIDVVGDKLISSFDFNDGTDLNISLWVHFVMECINNPVPLALFESLSDLDEPVSDWVYVFTNGSERLRETASLEFSSQLGQYVESTQIEFPAKQYCGFTKKKGDKNEWMASHPTDFHETLKKMVSYIKYKQNYISDRWEGIQPQNCRIDLLIPVIILQGEMVKIFERKDDIDVKVIEYHRFKTPFDGIYPQNIGIDILTEGYLETYLDLKDNFLKELFGNTINEMK